jgi:serine/threonine-protein kinase
MFSLAVVLYEMLTGVRVFQRDSAAASLASVLEHEVDPDPRIEPRLWVALSRALAKRPYERYTTCNEFAEAIRAAVGASDEDFAQALQEMRPRSDAIPEPSPSASGGVELASRASASSSSSRSARRKSDRNKKLIFGILGVGAVVVLGILVRAAIVGRGSNARTDDPPTAVSAPVVVVTSASPPQQANNIPPPAPANSNDIIELGPTPTPTTTTPTANAKGGGGTRWTGGGKTGGKTGGKKGPGDPATHPDF